MEKSKLCKLFIAALILIGVCFFAPEGNEVLAASKSSTEVYYEQFDIANYRSGDEYTAPKPTKDGYKDWIFAGWFKKANETSPIGTKTKTGTYYAKFVPSEVLSVKCQVLDGTTVGQETNSKLRIVSTIDSTRYNKVGFDIEVEGQEPISYESAQVAKSIAATADGVNYGYSPNIFDLKSNYFITVTITNIPSESFDTGFYIKPYWITKDNTKVYGVERYTRVEDSYLGIVNIPVRLYSDSTLTAGSATVEYDSTYFTYADTHNITLTGSETAIETPGYINGNLYSDIAVTTTDGSTKAQVKCTANTTSASTADGTFVHLRFKKNDNTFKRNEFAVSLADGLDEASIVAPDVIYSHYNSTYTGTADTSWYIDGETEFVITSPDELYGFAELVNDGTFTTEKVYLASDITVNKDTIDPTAENWTDGLTPWTPIGNFSANALKGDEFTGVFDGQEHTISGLYTDISENTGTAGYGAALFRTMGTDSEVKNFRIENSYFKATNYAGGVVGRQKAGTVSNVYSEATVELAASSSNFGAGGITGCSDNATVEKCLFAGSVSGGQRIGGIVGTTGGTAIIQDCLNEGSVYATNQQAGGIVGKTEATTQIIDCISAGTVRAKDQQAGGIVGQVCAETTIKESLNASTILIDDGITRNAGTIYGWNSTSNKGILTLTDVYGYTDTANVGVGTGTNATGKAETISDINAIYGYEALDGSYDLDSKFDFTNIWVVRATDTPVLKAWVEEDALHTPSTAWAGEGTKDNPWIIKTAGELYGLAKSVNAGNPYNGKYFALGANIAVNTGAASTWETKAPAYNWIPIGTTSNKFQGTFDGCGHKISGIYYSDSSATGDSNWRKGLFGSVENATITNVRLLNSLVQGGAYVGSFAGQAINTKFTNLYTATIVEAIYGTDPGAVGGIVGSISGGEITNCWNAESVTAGAYGHAGGIAGIADDISMSNCLNTGTVYGEGKRVGGFLGCIAEGSGGTVKLSDSLNLGSVNGANIVDGILANTGSAVGQLPTGTHLWVEQATVRTISSNLKYTIGTGFAGYVYNIQGDDKQQNNDYILTVNVDDIQGIAGYTGTKLTFDRPETEDVIEGAWVTTNSHPILGEFIDLFSSTEYVANTDMAGQFRADTEWADVATINENGANAYVIETPEDLFGFAQLVNGQRTFEGEIVYLSNDIVVHTSDAKTWGETEEGLQQWTPIGANSDNSATITFQGTFDGQGHNIEGLYFSDTSKGYTGWRVGLFGSVNGATITNVRLLNSMIQGGGYVGSFAGYATNSNFTNLYSDTIVNAIYSDGHAGETGGIVGLLNGGEISNCWNAGSVTSGKYGRTGGIVGSVHNKVTLSNCLNMGSVSSTSSYGSNTSNVCYYVGGFAGYLASGCELRLSDSLNLGSVSVSNSSAKSVGAALGTVPSGTTLYVEQESVHTILSGSVATTKYTIGSQFGGDVCDFAGEPQTLDNKTNIVSVDANNINGVGGYTGTGLPFDRPETTNLVEGAWVTTNSHPILGSFVDLFDDSEYVVNTEMAGQFRTDTAWAKKVTVETLDDGSTIDTYIIDRPEELIGFAKLVNEGNIIAEKKVYLGNDIVINTSNAEDWADGVNADLQQWTAIGTTTNKFKGIFDGRNYSISGIYFSDTSTSGQTHWRKGLFGSVENATITNTRLLNSMIQGGTYIGSFVGQAIDTEFTNLYADTIVEATYGTDPGAVGGIVGSITGGQVTNCQNAGSVTSGAYGRTGGIVGIASDTVTMSNCQNIGDVTSTGDRVGGIAGTGVTTNMNNCVNKGTVSGGAQYIGGLIGEVTGETTVNACANEGKVTGVTSEIGGLIGQLANNATKLTISHSWNSADVTAGNGTTTGMYVGGLIGFVGSTETVIEHCLNSGNIHFGNQQAGGLIGRINNGKITAITDCLNVGAITTDNANGIAKCNAGSILGYQMDGSVSSTSVYGYATNGIKVVDKVNAKYVGDGLDTPLQATSITDINEVYDVSLAGKLSTEAWTFRVANYPIPSVFATDVTVGDYSEAAVKDTAYVFDTELTQNEESGAYQITSPAQLYGFALLSQSEDYAGATVALAEEITVNNTAIDPDNEDAVYYKWLQIGTTDKPFAGTFNGQGNTIKGICRTGSSNVGLFTATAATSTLTDFRLEDSYFEATVNYSGSIASIGNGTFEKIYSNAIVVNPTAGGDNSGQDTGGFVGFVDNQLQISQCWFDGSVEAHSYKAAGFVAEVVQDASVTIQHSLNSGSVNSTHRRVGGLVGATAGAVTISDSMNTGDIYAQSRNGKEDFGSIVGYVDWSGTVEVDAVYGVNDFASEGVAYFNVRQDSKDNYLDKDGNITTEVSARVYGTLTGTVLMSTKRDRLIGSAGLDFDGDETTGFAGWMYRKEGTPVLTYFVGDDKVVKQEEVIESIDVYSILEMSYWEENSFTIGAAEDIGVGNYLLTFTGTQKENYDAYCQALEDGIFDAYNNDNSVDLNNEGVYNAIYTSTNQKETDSANDDWVVNVTYVDGTIYISVNTGQPLSEHLKADSIPSHSTANNEVNDGYTAEEGEVENTTFHMLQLSYYSASGYVIQLKNGHFIIIDGGMPSEKQADDLISYLKERANGKKPIIEAWVVSHAHEDHAGVLQYIVNYDNAKGYTDEIYVEGIYFNEAKEAITYTYDNDHHQYISGIKRAAKVFHTTTNGNPEIYRMQTGQRYTFFDITMDIILSQELITDDEYASTLKNDAGGAFNETSTWCMFTIEGEKLLTSGDAAEASKTRIVKMYDEKYLEIDVFTALHHGLNINRKRYGTLQLQSEDDFSVACQVRDIVLYPYGYDRTEENSQEVDTVNYPVANPPTVAERNENYIANQNLLGGITVINAQGVQTDNVKYLYYGQGTSILTFHPATENEASHITAELLASKYNYDKVEETTE